MKLWNITLKKIIHITNWYPNKENNQEAIWIKRQIASLNSFCQNEIYHIQVKEGKLSFVKTQISENEQSFILYFPTKIWFLKELLTTLVLWYILIIKIKKKEVFAYNFHIAYPLLTYSQILTFFIRKPIFVTEHWSAYHFNFGVKKKLKRIQRIFRNKKLRFNCVSKALVNDIINFANTDINYTVLYNVVDEKLFYNDTQERPINTFFMLSYWKYPKDPFLIFEVFKKLKEENGSVFQLKIGGFGPLMNEINTYIIENNLMNEFLILGKLTPFDIRKEMNTSSYFIHNSNYETFSVVCAESLMCGTPVIASKVGAIPEYLTSDMGLLVEENTFECWRKVINNCLNSHSIFENDKIAQTAKGFFSKETIGSKYYSILSNVVIK